MNKKALITATVQSHICQFHRPLVDVLHAQGYEVHVAAKNNLALKNGLKLDFVDKVYDIPFRRSPISIQNFKAYLMIKMILINNVYSVIHCNTPMGGVITRLATRKIRSSGTKVYYTAHGFHFYKGAPFFNWLLYYPTEWICSWFTDCLITINTEDYRFSKKYLHAKRVEYIHGVGANNERYNTKPMSEDFKSELGYNKDDFIILCSGELNKNKNQKALLYAVGKFKNSAVKTIIAGNGATLNYLRMLVKKLNIENNITFVGYRTDLEKYVKICDVVVSMSKREGLPLNIVEAMMCGKPIIVSDNRGHRDLIENGKGGFIVPYRNSEALVEKLRLIYSDMTLKQAMGKHNVELSSLFTDENVKLELKKVYGFYSIYTH